MQKEFTIKVPDEIWVNKWSEGREETYTYKGPEKIFVRVEKNEVMREWYERKEDVPLEDGEKVMEVDASEQPDVAHWFVTTDEDHVYEYVTITNHNGSTHEEKANPTIHDYFEAQYAFNRPKIWLEPIYKELDTPQEAKARKRLSFIKKYDKLYDFDDQTQKLIDDSIKRLNDYLKIMDSVYPWRYVEIPDDEIPRIPASLLKEFSDLPDLDGDQ